MSSVVAIYTHEERAYLRFHITQLRNMYIEKERSSGEDGDEGLQSLGSDHKDL